MKHRVLSFILIGLFAVPVVAIEISNGVDPAEVGHFRVNVTEGGEVVSAYITAERAAAGDVFTDQIIYDYFTYIDTGSEVFRLFNTNILTRAELIDTNTVFSSGTFVGSEGNNIEWTATSVLPVGDNTMVTTFTFTATTGFLGDMILHQYLDEDVNNSVSNDFLVRTGSYETRTLQLYTLDGVDLYGVSHSGAFSTFQGLVNATFFGWAADQFSQLRNAISGNSVEVSRSGIIDENDLPQFIQPDIGIAYGPEDITSTLAWKAAQNETSCTIITTLGGIPNAEGLEDKGIYTFRYAGPFQQPGPDFWEQIQVWNATEGKFHYIEDRLSYPNNLYEIGDLQPGNTYWLGAWNYTTEDWQVNVWLNVTDANAEAESE